MVGSAAPTGFDTLPGPPTFARTARLVPVVPWGEVEIPMPAAAPSPPQVSLVSIALPLVFSIVFVVAMVLLTRTQDSGFFWMSVLSFGFMTVTSIPPVISYYVDRRKHRQQIAERQETYHARLQQVRADLLTRRQQQVTAMRQIDPDVDECLARITRRDQRLWERTPNDQDFLSLRLGIGMRPFATRVTLPKVDASVEADPLVQAARDVYAEVGYVPDVPIALPLTRAGMAGLTGDRRSTVEMARALAVQIATHHSPDDVKIAAFYPASEAQQWEWLRWLPHVWSEDRSRRYLARDRESANQLLAHLAELFGRREEVARARNGQEQRHRPVIVCFLADPQLLAEQSTIPRLVSTGPSLGFHIVFVGEAPRRCSAFVELTVGQSSLVFTEPTQMRIPFRADHLPTDRAERMARSLASLRPDRRFDGQTTVEDVPKSVDLFELLGIDHVERFDALTAWSVNNPQDAIKAPVGRLRGGQSLIVNLQEASVGGHGSHAMMGGTPGSGKTQLLKAFIALLAAHYHPRDLSFMLIDYKGGSLLTGLEDLPHVTGRLTNLEKQDRQAETVERLFTCIGAELLRRRNVLGGRDINDFYRHTPQRRELNIPHLIVVIDEFAQLITQNPNSTELRNRLGEIAQQGRSLGVHLLLATQDPADAVEDRIQNTVDLRICLRMGSPAASRGILGSDLAYGTIGLGESGRGYYRVGVNQQPEPFQAPFADAPYHPGASAAGNLLEVLEVTIDGQRTSPASAARSDADTATGTQLKALVTHLRSLAERERIAPLPELLLKPLPELVTLDAGSRFEGWDGHTWQPVPPDRWLSAKIGLVDNPMEQSQTWLALNLAAGHLAVYGAPLTGKTTFVQTLVTSLVQTYSPDDIWFYILDFGGTLRRPFSGLPHVGAVIGHDEEDRLNRLLRFIHREIEARRTRFAEVGAQTLVGYRGMAAQADRPLPAIVLVLDNYARMATTYPDAVDVLAAISAQGVGYGIHLVLTANSPTLNFRLSANIVQAVAFRLADAGEYTVTVGRTGGREPAPIPGRALVKANPPMDVQTALPIEGHTDEDRAAALEEMARRMHRTWAGRRAHPIHQIPEVVALSDLLSARTVPARMPALRASAVPVGLDLDEAEPLAIDLQDGPHFVITGAVAAGKTTLLQSWLLALTERNTPETLQLYLVDLRREDLASLAALPHCAELIDDEVALDNTLLKLSEELAERRQALAALQQQAGGAASADLRLAGRPTIVLALDGFDELNGRMLEETKARLEEIVRRKEAGLGIHILLAARAGDLSSSYDSWVRVLLDRPTGFWIGAIGYGDLQMFNANAPASDPSRMTPAGEGCFIRRGRVRRLKVATAHAGGLTMHPWVARLAREWGMTGAR